MAGPGSNLTGHRANNTQIHNAGKKPPAPTWLGGPPQAALASPTSQLGYANQISGLQTTYAGALALQKATIAKARSDAILARQAAKSTAVAGMAGTVNNALDRGLLGSSIDLNGRADVLTQLGAAKQAALGAKTATIGAARADTIGAMGDYYLGLGQVQSQQAMDAAELSIDAYKNDQLGLLNQNFAAWQDYYANQMARRNRGRQRDLGFSNAVQGSIGAVGTAASGAMTSAARIARQAPPAPPVPPSSYTPQPPSQGGDVPWMW